MACFSGKFSEEQFRMQEEAEEDRIITWASVQSAAQGELSFFYVGSYWSAVSLHTYRRPICIDDREDQNNTP